MSVTESVELAVQTDDVPGAEGRVLSVVAESGVSVCALSSYRVGDRTIVLLVPEDPTRARQALQRNGFNCKTSPVVVVTLECRAGIIAQLGMLLLKAGVEILRSYAYFGGGDEIVAVFKTQDDPRAVQVLEDSFHLGILAQTENAEGARV